MIPTPYPYPYMGFGIPQPYGIAYGGDPRIPIRRNKAPRCEFWENVGNLQRVPCHGTNDGQDLD